MLLEGQGPLNCFQTCGRSRSLHGRNQHHSTKNTGISSQSHSHLKWQPSKETNVRHTGVNYGALSTPHSGWNTWQGVKFGYGPTTSSQSPKNLGNLDISWLRIIDQPEFVHNSYTLTCYCHLPVGFQRGEPSSKQSVGKGGQKDIHELSCGWENLSCSNQPRSGKIENTDTI